MTEQHPVERFRGRLATLARYPAGVVPVPAPIAGTAAFSGGAGLIMEAGASELPPFPFGGTMLVAHNLDSAASFVKRLASGKSHGGDVGTMPYWRNMYRLLDAAGIDRHGCFFTNAFVGLNDAGAVGRFPGEDDAQFRMWCREFLAEQITVMGPRLLVAVGRPAALFLGTMSADLADWRGKLPPPQQRAVTIAGLQMVVSVIFHPSAHNRPEYGKRAYDGRYGFDAEVQLLRDATRAARK